MNSLIIMTAAAVVFMYTVVEFSRIGARLIRK
jgi:hypothetical protein